MAILDRDTYIARVKGRIDENPSDDDVAFMEDMVDTFDSFSAATSSDKEIDWEQKYNDLNLEWETKYNDLDKDWTTKFDDSNRSWRERYIARFEGTSPSEVVEEQIEDVKEDGEQLTYDDLFETREGDEQ